MNITLKDIQTARSRIDDYVHHTPVLTCTALNRITDAFLHFKCENFQKVGAFKFRGASNAVFSLSDEEASRGVATHSSGNHAAALALAARIRGIQAHVVMPENAPETKKKAVAGYGAHIIYCSATMESREKTLNRVLEETGAVMIHPFNNDQIIAGQGTACLELMEELPQLDMIMVPVGGGGLLSGTSIAAKGLNPNILVYGAEPKAADDAFQSFKAGRLIPGSNPRTIADGLLASLGEKPFPYIQENVHDILTVSEENIIKAMRLIWERMKIIVEPSAAVPLGALLDHPRTGIGKRIGIILSGGNVDLEKLPF